MTDKTCRHHGLHLFVHPIEPLLQIRLVIRMQHNQEHIFDHHSILVFQDIPVYIELERIVPVIRVR